MPKEVYLKDNTLITSKTDLKGHITYGNADFACFSGFSEEEFLGQPHNLIRHPDMPHIAFKVLWDNIQHGREFFGFVKNLSKQKNIYWVFANITPSFDEHNHIIGYYSVRRRPSKEGVAFMSDLYAKLRAAEAQGGMHASLELLTHILQEAHTSYDELVIELQNTALTKGYHQ
ncbi:PAS domain-containing protein [Helicobacter jaachi]|uniref:PAS domain-containing protein n=1 Tax=Helicobacter jaachi TaxID=1677920 RepID=A0A4U8T9Y1_9HELI|nr:PAS domain-containing protein [Helicobacter jaachi]TLD96609.1 PAS domain-containing protein [Helicobacter jaachi]